MAGFPARSLAVYRADALTGAPMAWRPLALAFLAALIAPVTWLRSPLPSPDTRALLQATPLAGASGAVGPFILDGAWHLKSPNSAFGGYSALVALPGGRLLAGSDSGGTLEFKPPGTAPARPVFRRFGGEELIAKSWSDLESLTRDPATGRLWGGLEGVNAIMRTGPDQRLQKRVEPPEMAQWGSNSGAETLTRLADGRFLAVAEGASGWIDQGHRALLFPGDPVMRGPKGTGRPVAFRLIVPDGYSPVDAAQVPDGRVLILLRKLERSLPPQFGSALMVADPALISPGRDWRGDIIARFAAPVPPENYEGLAVVPEPAGGLTLWIIADDNRLHVQRTLLLRLRWPAGETRPDGAQRKGRADRSARPS